LGSILELRRTDHRQDAEVKLRLPGAGALALALALAGPVRAHEGLHEQIAEVSARIARSPNDANLYLKRADLRRMHEEWSGALGDYRAAEKSSPTLIGIPLGRGLLWLARGRDERAIKELDKVVLAAPNHVEALVARARAFAGLGKGRESAADFSAAIAVAQQPEPEWYLERAQALATLASGGVDEAISGLDEGLRRFGPLPTLGLYAVELEQSRGKFDAAIARLDALRANASRQETWWERIGDVQARAGRIADAHSSYAKAQQALLVLPERLRDLPATQALAIRLKDKLGRTSEPSASIH